jgi:hypothetical protein
MKEGRMSRRLKKVGLAVVVVLIVVLAAAQLVRPDRTNPKIDFANTLQGHTATSNGLVAVVDRSCGDCHSNATVWARYTNVAPLSWLITLGVTEGRKALNFSEWAAYSPEKRQELLKASCRDAEKGTMPMNIYLKVRPEARLSAQDIETICAASRSGQRSAAR